MIRNIFFDLDCTLLPMKNQDAFVNYYLNLLGKKVAKHGIDPNEFIKLVFTAVKKMCSDDATYTNEDTFFNLFEETYKEKAEDLKPVFLSFYANEFNEAACKTYQNPDLINLVKRLKEEGYNLVLATSPFFPRVAVLNRLKWAGLDESYFSHICSYEEYHYTKPNTKYFLELLDKTCKTLINANATSVEEALTVAVDGGTLNDLFVNATATIGEKITLRRFEVLTKTDDQVFGAYMHMGGKISAVVVANGAKADVAKDMAMQVASMNPQYVSRANMPAEVVEHETNVQKEILKNDPKLASKPEKVLAGIIEGRVSKTLQEMCLVDQLFFKNQDIKCGQYLKENGMEVVSFVKYTVGEGLEKREENFAEEVAKQMAK